MASSSGMTGLSARLRSSLRAIDFKKGLILAFVVGFAIRLIPEVLSFPYPIGFDTVYYAWRIKSGVVWYDWSQVFTTTWLLYGLLIPVYNLVRGDPFLVLKVAAPLLFGLDACGVYYFAVKALNWTNRKSLLAAGLFSFQFAALALSWGFFRNVLGLGVLLFALPWVKNGVRGWKEFGFLALLSVLIVFSHEYAAVVLFVAVGGIILGHLLKTKRVGIVRVLAAVSPAFVLFLTRFYYVFSPVVSSVQDRVIMSYQPVGHYGGALFFFTNYLAVSDSVQIYSSYLDLVISVFSLFALFFIVLMPLVLVGFFRDKVLDSWVLLLLVGSFGAVVVPVFALDLWSRWMLMLVFPFTFYAANGVARVFHTGGMTISPGFRRLDWLKLSKRSVKGLLVVSASLSLVYMCVPLFFGQAGVFGFPTTVNYAPSTMQSTTVPLVDVDGTARSMEWLNTRMGAGSVLLAQDAFFYWARLYVDNGRSLVYFKSNVLGAVDLALERGFNRVYFVWWNENIGWYGLTVPAGFTSVYSSGRISVFEYFG